MNRTCCLPALALVLSFGSTVPADEAGIAWKKTVLDTKFRSEGVAIADVNKDGKVDVINGEIWYEAPSWKPHEIRKPGEYGDGEAGYSNSFACWAEDVNRDGWDDLIVISFPGKPCHWFENPQNKPGHWKQHEIWHSACNETPLYADLLGTGKRVLVMGWQPKGANEAGNQGQMSYFTPGKDPTGLWEMHPISGPSKPGMPVPGTFRYAHGLGVGDVNGDGKNDVLCTGGWWEQPAKLGDEPWKFHPAKLGEACADMFAYDVDGDGKNDVVSSSAHKFGIWWHQQRDAEAFLTHTLFKDLNSETHAMHCVDIDRDGVKDFVTGKRFYSHGKREPGWDKPAAIYWLRAVKGSDGVVKFEPKVIDMDSGIGTQFVVGDINGDGLLDVITSNKKGTFLVEQLNRTSGQ